MKLKNKYKKNIFNIKYNMKKNIWKKKSKFVSSSLLTQSIVQPGKKETNQPKFSLQISLY